MPWDTLHAVVEATQVVTGVVCCIVLLAWNDMILHEKDLNEKWRGLLSIGLFMSSVLCGFSAVTIAMEWIR